MNAEVGHWSVVRSPKLTMVLSLPSAPNFSIIEASIIKWLAINLHLLRCRENEVHPCWLVMGIRPAMDRASLDANVTSLHVDHLVVVEVTEIRGQLLIPD